MESKRPVFLDLLKIRLPVTASASIFHRIAGVMLFLSLPLLLYLLELSLSGTEGYGQVVSMLDAWWLKIWLLLLLWWFAHHLLAGLRFLLIDIGVGEGLLQARRSAWWVNWGGVAVLLLAMGCLL